METYPGGKAGAGVYQRIINLIPQHDTYIETHLGGGAIMRYKKPAKTNIGIDLDHTVIKKWQEETSPKVELVCDDAVVFLNAQKFTGTEFVYADPPYLMKTRRNSNLYAFEYTREDHINLLACLKTLPCAVMLSGYWSTLYAKKLSNWNTYNFQAQTQSGKPATEWLWMNYPKPEQLHDYRYLGDTFRERERIKRKTQRWTTRLQSMPRLERQALYAALGDVDLRN